MAQDLAQIYLLKGLDHLDKFEEAQAEMAKIEHAEILKARQALKARDTTVHRDNHPVYVAAKILEQDFWYKRAASKRNGHQLAANMYFNAAQAVAHTGVRARPKPPVR